MTITAKVLADTYNSYTGSRLTTFELYYPRFIHSEVMTYRMWSRNASSSRAIPVKTMIKNILADPAMPLHWGANQKGMQADHENRDEAGNYVPVYAYADEKEFDATLLEEDEKVVYIKKPFLPQMAWKVAMWAAVHVAKAFDRAGYHKQIVNRILEPFMHIRVVVTATDYDNMFAQRLHPDAQPEFQELAKQIKVVMLGSNPVLFNQEREADLDERYHHLPYLTADDRTFIKNWADTAWGDLSAAEKAEYQDDDHFYGWTLMKVCSARCARVSYHLHDGKVPDILDDLRLADDLIASGHWSPFEHACIPCGCPGYHYNLRGFVNFRNMLDQWRTVLDQQKAAMENAKKIAEITGGVVHEGPDGTPYVVQTSELTSDNDAGTVPPKGRTLN